MTKNEDYLRLLSIFYYVLAGLQALMGCIPIIHVVLGASVMSGAFMPPPDQVASDSPVVAAQMEAVAKGMTIFGGFFMAAGLIAIALSWGIAALYLMAGRSMANRRRHTFCLVTAGIACIMFPIGTTLGVFTFILLLKPEVRMLFEGQQDYDYEPPAPDA